MGVGVVTHLRRGLNLLIAGVWIVNGLFCKVLNGVPRHRLIVARILGDQYASQLTMLIGVAEIFMAIWILSGIRTRLSAIAQIIVVASMNSIEFFMAPDLLLFGRINAVVALAFIAVIYLNEFILHRKIAGQ